MTDRDLIYKNVKNLSCNNMDKVYTDGITVIIFRGRETIVV